MKRRVVVMGVGNPLYGDDGFGIAAVAEFDARYVVRSGAVDDVEVDVLDAGTEGLALLGHIEDATDLVILDVVEGGGRAPGQRVEYDAATLATGTPIKLSQHQVGVEEVLGLAVWRGRLPERSVLLGVVPHRLDFGVGLSEPVARALPEVLARAADVLRRWGLHVTETVPLVVGA